MPELREADLYGPMYKLIQALGAPELVTAIERTTDQEVTASSSLEELLSERVNSWSVVRTPEFNHDDQPDLT